MAGQQQPKLYFQQKNPNWSIFKEVLVYSGGSGGVRHEKGPNLLFLPPPFTDDSLSSAKSNLLRFLFLFETAREEWLKKEERREMEGVSVSVATYTA